ncbi:2-isopropylmalate synthase [Peptococcus simiae]|uniref:2-isopropylmalate synthase n=1 Tax=Peptococcus simiae TaxID=1643805 RepID=A0ABW9GYV6_9FIRM
MKQIRIFDTTLRDGEQSPGCSMNLKEKLQLAAQIDELGVDCIEAGFAASSPEDFRSVTEIAKSVKNAYVVSLARALKSDIDKAYEAVQHAAKPMIHTFIATSDIHMEYKLKMTPDQVLDKVTEAVSYAKSKCDQVEFSAEDASRTRPEFLWEVCQRAVDAGASVVNLPDTVGYATPAEMTVMIKGVKDHVKGIDDVIISTHCHNDLGLALANSLAAIEAGARQVECTVNGIGERAGNCALEEVAMILKTRQDYYQASCRIDTKQIYRTSRMLSAIIGVPVAPTKPIVGKNVFAHESGIHQHGVLSNKSTYEIMSRKDIGYPEQRMVLGKHSGRHAFKAEVANMGYHLTEEELNDAFHRFKDLADKKKDISDRDIESVIMGQQSSQITPYYSLKAFNANVGSLVSAMACVQLNRDEDKSIIEQVAKGDGPIDAAYSAINNIIGVDAQLESYQINSISEGVDAQGEALIKLSCEGKYYTGRATSTNIIDASLMAYINGVNQIISRNKSEQI